MQQSWVFAQALKNPRPGKRLGFQVNAAEQHQQQVGELSMNEMTITTAATMTSREIADLVGSRHDAVKQSIERLSARRVIGSPSAVEYLSNRGQPAIEYRISKRDSFIVAAQISPASISGVVDAWGRAAQSLDEILSALDAFDVPGDLEGMFVYAIRNTVTGSVKLGISRDPVQRVKQLQTGNDCPLELIACRKADNGFADERAIHQENSQHHIRGEWFSSEVQEVLK